MQRCPQATRSISPTRKHSCLNCGLFSDRTITNANKLRIFHWRGDGLLGPPRTGSVLAGIYTFLTDPEPEYISSRQHWCCDISKTFLHFILSSVLRAVKLAGNRASIVTNTQSESHKRYCWQSSRETDAQFWFRLEQGILSPAPLSHLSNSCLWMEIHEMALKQSKHATFH